MDSSSIIYKEGWVPLGHSLRAQGTGMDGWVSKFNEDVSSEDYYTSSTAAVV
jgi:hypothetical protein